MSGVLYTSIRKNPAAMHPVFVFRERGRFANMGGPPGRIKASPARSVRSILLLRSPTPPGADFRNPRQMCPGSLISYPVRESVRELRNGSRRQEHAIRSAGPDSQYRRIFPSSRGLPSLPARYERLFAAFMLSPGIPAGRGIPSPAPRESAASAGCGFWRNVVY